jgi:hypothetical protein
MNKKYPPIGGVGYSFAWGIAVGLKRPDGETKRGMAGVVHKNV